MALDTVTHRVFVGYRHPALLVVQDGQTGKDITVAEMTGDADDLYYNSETSEVYISGGDGYISIFRQQGDTYRQVANIPTRKGARTSLFIPQLHLFVLATRAEGGKSASLIIYKSTQ